MNITRNWLTRYHPYYARSLVYMLQASEYNVRDYLDWLWRTSNFKHVEKRKQLVLSVKSVSLLICAWVVQLLTVTVALGLLLQLHGTIRYAMFLCVLVSGQFVLPYILVIATVALQYIQRPIEQRIIRRAQQRISAHKGLRIAIAGSYGKTTMREIIRTVLAQGKKVAAPPHSYNTPLAIGEFVEALKGDEDIIIFELGEYYPGDVETLCALVKPHVGIITGVNEAHLKKFKTLDRTLDTIFELANYVSPDKLYINGESQLVRSRVADENLVYSRAGVGSWAVQRPQTSLAGTWFQLRNGDTLLSLHSQLLGLHQVGPLVVAVDIAGKLGLTHKQIEEGVGQTTPFDHRLKPIILNGVVTLDDSYNGNPDGVNAIIDFASSLKGHRRFYVTPGLVEMGTDAQRVHELIGNKLAESGIEWVVLIKNSVTPFILKGLQQAAFQGQVLWFDDMLAALQALPHLTVGGDVVVLQNDWPDQYE